MMGCLGNVSWFLFGGFLSGCGWLLSGCLWRVTIIRILVGLQCFKLASLYLFPFGKEVMYGGGSGSLLSNIVWFLVPGLPLALESVVFGILLCITVVGIPFELQRSKIARLALMPFGSEIISL